ncbi:lipopolysaccharide kinase InaA family protein [Halioglobus pacificus]|uniref:Lipopolysaccharide kinase (Kdo/WaaP) family protein n=1 Tax=Parahalioglobus pacificus TaxID=930806 RepID=A0A919CIM7_9GAMM|nr:lipopolysaccharide kinase InaA family protein [Halioglobus pacificus]GHD28280.1 hypothetical protein GCM10007053_07500 [Halioglobus pacificus]
MSSHPDEPTGKLASKRGNAGALLRAFGSSLRLLNLPSTPQASATVDDDFFGINIAPGEDPADDSHLLALIGELGLTQVRMDLSYDALDGPGERLLRAALAQGLSVLLNLFPLPEQAARLNEAESMEHWRDFLETVFERYGKALAVFEIGATPNRARWSGFDYRTLPVAWHVAQEAADRFSVTLAGPNVSDFEPLYNSAFLEKIAAQGRPPAVHTDNLFVERVIEPEAYDHRVAGALATPLLKLNLIKKARLLAALGALHGSPRLWCTYTGWTVKRLARRSPRPEQKQSDYLVRYLLLAAASGALERVYWGPLVCGRDGIIDDGLRDYPEIDQVSWYRQLRAGAASWRKRPAFAALAYTRLQVASSELRCLTHDEDGLSVFQVSSARGQHLVLWCRDNQTRAVAEVLPGLETQSLGWFDQNGHEIDAPVVISEHPVWLELATNAQPTIGKLSQVLGQQLHTERGVSLPSTTPEWRGAVMLSPESDSGQAQQRLASLLPQTLLKQPERAVLRDTRNRIWNIDDSSGVAPALSVKLNRVAGIKRLTYLLKPSKGRRHWDNAVTMVQRGINTPMPRAYFERHHQPGVKDSWYVCEFIPDAFSAREVYAAFREGETSYRGLDKSGWYTLLAGFVCRMHNAQIAHKDLSAGNLLLRQDDAGNIEPMLIDIGRAWVWRGPGSKLTTRQRLADLMRIAYKLNWLDREHFAEAYTLAWKQPLPNWWRIPFHYYDNKQRFKKAIKGKRKKARKVQS